MEQMLLLTNFYEAPIGLLDLSLRKRILRILGQSLEQLKPTLGNRHQSYVRSLLKGKDLRYLFGLVNSNHLHVQCVHELFDSIFKDELEMTVLESIEASLKPPLLETMKANLEKWLLSN